MDRSAWKRALLAGATVASFCVEGVGTAALAKVNHADMAGRLRELMSLLEVT
jgi:hypothetical protein